MFDGVVLVIGLFGVLGIDDVVVGGDYLVYFFGFVDYVFYDFWCEFGVFVDWFLVLGCGEDGLYFG